MTKKTTKNTPQASKKTRNAIAFFKERKSATDIMIEPDGRVKLKLSPYAGKPSKTYSINYEYIFIGLLVIGVSALMLWLIKQ